MVPITNRPGLVALTNSKPCTRRRDSPMNGRHDHERYSIAPIACRRSGRIRGDRGRSSGQALQGHPRRRRYLVPHCARQHYRAARRQRRRQDHDHRDDHGAGAADLGAHPGAGRGDARAKRRGARPDEFRKPLCRHADAAHGAAESHDLRPALCRGQSARAHRAIGRRSRSRRFPRSRQWQALRRAENPRRAGESADQSAGTVVAGRADGVARP